MDNFGQKVFEKLVENFCSVKVQVIFSLLIISTYALWEGKLSGDVWAGVNGGVISTVFAMREAFKVAKVKSPDEDTKNMMT